MAQKLTDLTVPDPDPRHWLQYNYKVGTVTNKYRTFIPVYFQTLSLPREKCYLYQIDTVI
jgi:hypothetical protein